MYPSIKSWNNPREITLPGNCASIIKSHTHHSEQHQPPIKEKPITIDLMVYKHTQTHTHTHTHTHTNYATSLTVALSGSSQTLADSLPFLIAPD